MRAIHIPKQFAPGDRVEILPLGIYGEILGPVILPIETYQIRPEGLHDLTAVLWPPEHWPVVEAHVDTLFLMLPKPGDAGKAEDGQDRDSIEVAVRLIDRIIPAIAAFVLPLAIAAAMSAGYLPPV